MTETQTVDLVAWLTRIWDEEERLARHREVSGEDAEGVFLVSLHDGSTLAQIAAKRLILGLHIPTPTTLEEVDGREVEADSFEEIVSREVNCMACAGYPEAPCLTLKALASPYKGREGWQEAWDG